MLWWIYLGVFIFSGYDLPLHVARRITNSFAILCFTCVVVIINFLSVMMWCLYLTLIGEEEREYHVLFEISFQLHASSWKRKLYIFVPQLTLHVFKLQAILWISFKTIWHIWKNLTKFRNRQKCCGQSNFYFSEKIKGF